MSIYRWKISFRFAIIFHRTEGKERTKKFIWWREIMTFFFFFSLPFLVVTFLPHTTVIIIFCSFYLNAGERRCDLWFLSPYICVIVLLFLTLFLANKFFHPPAPTIRKSRGGKGKEKSITIIDFGNLTNCYLHFTQLCPFLRLISYLTLLYEEKFIYIDIDVKIISNSLDRYLTLSLEWDW